MNIRVFQWILIYSFIMLTVVVFLPVGNTDANEAEKKIDIATDPGAYLFKIGNMKPGDMAHRTLTVQNKGNQDFEYTMTADHKSGSEKLYNQLILKVTDKKGALYSGKLSNFIGFDQMRPLTSLGEENLQFTIHFPWESGNEFQGLATEVALKFAVKGDTGTIENNDTPAGEVTDTNLPQTGEMNPVYFYLIGMLLFLIAFVLHKIGKKKFTRDQ